MDEALSQQPNKMNMVKQDNRLYKSHFNNTVKLLQKAEKTWFSDYQNKRLFTKSIDHIKDYKYLVETCVTNNWTLKTFQEELMSRDTLKRTDAVEMIPYTPYQKEGRFRNPRSAISDNESDLQTDYDRNESESSDDSAVYNGRTQKNHKIIRN